MKNVRVNVIEIEVDGIKYTQTRPNYYYKKVEDKNVRIPKAEWEQAFDAYIAQVDEADEDFDASDEIKARKEIEGQKDRETEKNFNSKKTTKSRRSKNAAYKKQVGGVEITLTEKQVDFFRHMQDTCFWENGLDSTPWIDVLCDEIGGQFEGKPMTVGAMVSTLKEKDLLSVGARRVDGRKAKFFALTDLGKKVAVDLGLK